MGVEMLGGS